LGQRIVQLQVGEHWQSRQMSRVFRGIGLRVQFVEIHQLL
jgi:hypothetical protein